MKGNRLSQKTLAELVRGIEEKSAAQQFEVVEVMFD
jgi:hypothetical protein